MNLEASKMSFTAALIQIVVGQAWYVVDQYQQSCNSLALILI